MNGQILSYAVFELIVIALLIYACVREEELIAFENRVSKDISDIRRACKRQNIGFGDFLQMLFACACSEASAKRNARKSRRMHGKRMQYETFSAFFSENAQEV